MLARQAENSAGIRVCRNGTVLATHPRNVKDDALPSSRLPPSLTVPAGLEDLSAVTPVLAGSAGILAGAAIGAFAGPIGAIAGAVAGAVAGAAAGATLNEEEAMRGAAERELDEEIGVLGGSLGAAAPDAPRSERGTFSAASSGAGGAATEDDGAPVEGAIPRAG